MIGEVEREALHDLRQRAARSPIDMVMLSARLATAEGKRAHRDQMTAQTVEIPLAYLVTFSIEIGHPVGVCRHMSMSVQRPGRVPSQQGAWIVAELLGFVGGLQVCRWWLEDLQGHGKAINLVQPVSVQHG